MVALQFPIRFHLLQCQIACHLPEQVQQSAVLILKVLCEGLYLSCTDSFCYLLCYVITKLGRGFLLPFDLPFKCSAAANPLHCVMQRTSVVTLIQNLFKMSFCSRCWRDHVNDNHSLCHLGMSKSERWCLNNSLAVNNAHSKYCMTVSVKWMFRKQKLMEMQFIHSFNHSSLHINI